MTMKRYWLVFLILLIPGLTVWAQQPTLREADRIRLAEAFRLADAVRPAIWDGWAETPFAVLLVTADHEFLIRHPRPSDDFTALSHDALLQSDVYVRDRVFQPNLLATFPAVGGLPTVVVGQPEQTGQPSTRWVVTLLHEHFHQLQDGQPDHYAAVQALDLAGDDESGRWMVNYPFPYDAPDVVTHASRLTDAAVEALKAVGTPSFNTRLDAYRAARQHLKALLPNAPYRYLSFQLWKEGVSRYIEYKVAKAASRGYTPSEAFRQLKDFEPYDKAAEAIYEHILDELTHQTLDQYQRVLFYPLGAAEALLLDAARPGWHNRYFTEKFYLDAYF
jgi:hypothetical protein